MIRALALILALLIGAVAALATQGRMAHLRAVAADRLPAWTASVAPRSGLLSGSATLGSGAAADATIRWSARAPTTDGLRWSVTVDGGGVDLAADATLAFTAQTLHLDRLRGTLALDDQPDRACILRIGRGRAALSPLPRIAKAAGTVDVNVQATSSDGRDLGRGTVTAERGASGDWRATLSFPDAAPEGQDGAPAADGVNLSVAAPDRPVTCSDLLD